MRHSKTAYELAESQVQTPREIISLFWDVVRKTRSTPGRVLDVGAGDARFAKGGHYTNYDGIEIDPNVSRGAVLPKNARVHNICAFRYPKSDYDMCIGNPPYVRHHDIEALWKKRTTKRIQRELGIEIDNHGNLYLYFLCLGILKTRVDGLIGLVIPFEWVSRPSAAAIRDYIKREGWNVSVYRFQQPIFPGVLTTASISLIDKKRRDKGWRYFDILQDLSVQNRYGISGNSSAILTHSPRGQIWARRGLSPGSQKLFTLTEAERIEGGLTRRDVIPCVTTFRHLPNSLEELNERAFRKHFVSAGLRCWLIRSTTTHISKRLKSYLDRIPVKLRETYTCINQEPWYAYEEVPIPKLLFHSGFMEFGPKIVVNTVRAQAVGSVYGIHSKSRFSVRDLQAHLLHFNFENRIVPLAKTLLKVEVRQLNSVLTAWWKRQHHNG